MIEKMEHFVCDINNCGRRFQQKARLVCHKRVHSKTKPFVCDVDGCGAAYAWHQHLKRHEKNVHSHPQKEFKCSKENCMATFDTEFGLKQHIKRSHFTSRPTGDYKYKCSHCDELFLQIWQVQEHEASHTNDVPFSCDICHEEFRAFILLNKHNRLKHYVKPSKKRSFKCKECSEVYDNLDLYDKHRKEHSLKRRTCKSCNLVFQRQSHMEQHALIAHSENQVEYKCKVEGCARVYSYKRNLTQHMKVAHEGKSYNCNLCGKSLTSQQKLKLHMSNHMVSPKKPPERKKKAGLVREKLLKQLAGNGSNAFDLEVTPTKPAIRNPHVAHIFAAKEQFPPEPEVNQVEI